MLTTKSNERSIMHSRMTLALTLGIFTSLAVSIKLDAHKVDTITLINQSFVHASFQLSLLTIIATYGLYHLLPHVKRSELGWTVPLSAIAGFTVVLAESYNKTYSWRLVFGGMGHFAIALLKMAGTSALFFAALTLASSLVLKPSKDEDADGRSSLRTFGLIFLVIILCWLPYIISLYPASIVPDAVDQVAQFTGTKEFCRTIHHSTGGDGSTLLNTHHPILHTLLIGACLKVGNLFGSGNAGFFIYALIQTACLASALAYQATYLKTICPNKTFNSCVLAFSALNPLFPIWGMTVDKDVYFTILIWLSTITLYRIVRNSITRVRAYVLWGIIVLLWLLSRNGGEYVIVASLPLIVALLWDRKRLLSKIATTLVAACLIYVVVVQSIFFNVLGAARGSVREMMSVPFMQTARLVRDHPESLSEEDAAVLIDLFGDEDASLTKMVEAYTKRPNISDDVKALFDDEKTDKLGPYMTVWMHGLTSHPKTYLQAFLCLDYAWVYPDKHVYRDAYTKIYYTDRLNVMAPGTHEPSRLKLARNIITEEVKCLPKLPLVGPLFDFSYYTWIYFSALIMMIRRKKVTEIAAMSFLFFYYCLVFLSPVPDLRYVLFAILALPTLIAFTLSPETERVKV